MSSQIQRTARSTCTTRSTTAHSWVSSCRWTFAAAVACALVACGGADGTDGTDGDLGAGKSSPAATGSNGGKGSGSSSGAQTGGTSSSTNGSDDTSAASSDPAAPSSNGTDPSTQQPAAPGSKWAPTPGTSWQWQLTGTVDTTVNVKAFDIDLFDAPVTTINAIHAKGAKVVCYFSAGSYENWRSDASSFPAAALGSDLDGWPGERWLDVRSTALRAVMAARLDLAASKGCDAVEPDNVDGYANSSGFPLTAADQLDYNKWIANEAHARNLGVALKNDLDQIGALVSFFDFAVVEECFKYNECALAKPFIAANKAVFEVEYGSASLASSICPKANPMNFDTLIKQLDLDATRTSCR